MKVSKTKNRFKTGFQQLKTGFPKNPVLTSLNITECQNDKVGEQQKYLFHETAQNNSGDKDQFNANFAVYI